MKRTVQVIVFGVALILSPNGFASSEEEEDDEGEELATDGEEEESSEEEEEEEIAACGSSEGEDGEETAEDCEEEPETTIAEEEEENPEIDPETETTEQLVETIETTPAFPDEPEAVPVPNPPLAVEEPTPPPAQRPWTPSNNGEWRPQVAQSEIQIACTRIGAGQSGYVRYGCRSMKLDGTPYGIVVGWWRILKSNGARARTKHLNFRVAGYDMAFDVYAPDAAGGIVVKPGWGEQKPIGRR